MKKTKKLVVLAMMCVMLFGSTLAVHAAPSQDSHVCEGAECSYEDSLASFTPATIYRSCLNTYCTVYRCGPSPFDYCGVCALAQPATPYHCRFCGWNPAGDYCGFYFY